MLQVTYCIKHFMQVLSSNFKDAPKYNKTFSVKPTGRFVPSLRRVCYGLGDKFALRYVTDTEELLCFVSIALDNTAQASVSWKSSACSRQWKFTLVNGFDGTIHEHGRDQTLFAWFTDNFSEEQSDMFGDALHVQASTAYAAWTHPFIEYDKREFIGEPAWFDNTQSPQKRENTEQIEPPEQADSSENEKPGNDTAVSFRYKSPENLGYCVIVYDVTGKSRCDRYAVSIKTQSFMLNNILLLYKRGFHGKLLALIAAEHKVLLAGGDSHLLQFTKMARTHTQAVCVTSPESHGVVDLSIQPGQVFDVKASENAMDNSQYITIHVNGQDIERNANNFVIFNRR